MQDKSLRVLIVEDSEEDALFLIRNLKKGGYNPVYERVYTASLMKKAINEKQWDIILCDYKLPGFNVTAAISILKETNTDIPIIIVSGIIGEETAIECMRLGARDYLMKDKLSRLCTAIARELEDAKVRKKGKRTKEKLLHEEHRFRVLAEQSSDIIVLFNPEGTILYENPAVEKILGFNVKERIGSSIFDLIHPDDLKIATDKFRIMNKKANALAERFEIRLRHKNGGWHTFEVTVSIIINDEKIEGGIINLRDITKRKQEEEEISKLTSVVRFSSELVNLATLDGKMIFLNEAGSRMLGIAPDKVGEYSIMDVIPEFLHSKVRNELLPPLLAGNNWEGELQYRNVRTGHLTNVYAMTFDIKDTTTGKPFCIANVSRDITKSKKAEEALKQSEEKYRLLADHMKDQVWLMDLDLKWKYISPSLEKLLGYNLEELIQLPLAKLLPTTSLKKAMEHFSTQLSKAITSSKPSSTKNLVELEFICKNGQLLWAECAFSFIRDEKGKPLSILGESRDITERKRAEEKLQQTLESLKRAVGTTIQVLVSALEVRDPYTAGHQSRVADLACAIATEMGLDKGEIEGIRMAGSIHDIGKLSIPAEILTKPTKLTDNEFALIKVHSETGYDMLKDVESPWPLAQIVYQHHERMDGSGYPNNLKGDKIILDARIMAVADVVEAMASHRPYRAALGMEKALDEIMKNKGILYDEIVADICLKLFTEKGYHFP
jgi:PAS domain S-box-containing protein